MKRLLAIADIHGCYVQLMALLEQVKLKKQDRLIFLGDYSDRGPDTRSVINTLIKLQKDFPRTICLAGNHDWSLMRAYINRHKLAGFFTAEKNPTIASYGNSLDDVPASHISFLQGLKLYHQEKDFLFVHAGLRPEVPLKDQTQDDLLTIRKPFLESDFDFGFRVVHGHTVSINGPTILPNRIGLDTGPAKSVEEGAGKLTCMDLLTQEFWQS